MSNRPSSPRPEGTPATRRVEPVPRDRLPRPWEPADGPDFPFYAGQPAAVGSRGWLLVVAAVVVGFAALALISPPGPVLSFLPALLLAGLPLLALRLVAGRAWTSLFRRVRVRDLGLMLLFAVLNLVVSFSAGFVVAATAGGSANPAAGELAQASALEVAVFYPRTAVQLLGEELLTILPFLALLHLLTARFGWSRGRAVVLAWVVTAVAFGLAHLPTYDWNLLQCLLVIGLARVVLTLAYVRTKNLWISFGAHGLNDWTLFTVPLVTAALG